MFEKTHRVRWCRHESGLAKWLCPVNFQDEKKQQSVGRSYIMELPLGSQEVRESNEWIPQI
jgi:hypothetical protein